MDETIFDISETLSFISCLIEITPVCNVCPWFLIGHLKISKYIQCNAYISKRYCTLLKFYCKVIFASSNNSCHRGKDIGHKLSSLCWYFEGVESPLDHDSQFLDQDFVVFPFKLCLVQKQDSFQK